MPNCLPKLTHNIIRSLLSPIMRYYLNFDTQLKKNCYIFTLFSKVEQFLVWLPNMYCVCVCAHVCWLFMVFAYFTLYSLPSYWILKTLLFGNTSHLSVKNANIFPISGLCFHSNYGIKKYIFNFYVDKIFNFWVMFPAEHGLSNLKVVST